MITVALVVIGIVGVVILCVSARARYRNSRRSDSCQHEGLKAVFVAQDGIYELCGACAGLEKISKETPTCGCLEKWLAAGNVPRPGSCVPCEHVGR